MKLFATIGISAAMTIDRAHDQMTPFEAPGPGAGNEARGDEGCGHTRLTTRRPKRPLGRTIKTTTIRISARLSFNSRPR